jgi:2-keto-4-pentenoate hydratase/2-oxohepta-3-ene-1,7-dioic acid hydratase in catechol pathway
MKLARIAIDGYPQYARLEEDQLFPLGTDDLLEALDATTSAAPQPLDRARLLAPLRPPKIVAIGRNYADHARELGNELPKEPLLFLKPPTTVIGSGERIILPPESERVDFEGELAVVIGRRGRRIEAADWRDYVLGYSCANDVTARDLQKKDVQFTRGKGFDTFCPLGPVIVTNIDPADLSLVTRVDGEVRQNGRTSDMVFQVGALIAYISAVMTLEPGDLILTGTPAGVGPLAAGETVEVEIEGIGSLSNRVVKQ